jgi:23S rRNA (pseudouridine1915-N3)-methyltransferase
MRLRIVALGHRMPTWVEAGVGEYSKRVSRDYPLELIELRPEPRGRGKPLPQILAAEAQRLVVACKGCAIVALDEQGEPWTTRRLALHLAAWRDAATDVAFAIGSADGLDPRFRAQASARVAVSAMTLPHGLVRVIIAEQIYRAASLLAGHPYHRE